MRRSQPLPLLRRWREHRTDVSFGSTQNYRSHEGTITLFIREDFEEIVAAALEEIPDDIAARLDNVVLVVEARDPHGEGLLGFYHGIPLPDRGMNYAGVLPDRISIFMDTHLALGLDHEGTSQEIRRTVLHEIAHHLGIDDLRLRELGWG